MEEPRDPSRPAIAAPPTTTAYAPQPALPYAAPAPRASHSNVLIRTLRLLLRRMLYGVARVGRVLWPFRLTLGVSAVLLGIIGWLSVLLFVAPLFDSEPDFSQARSIPPVPAVEAFLRGQQTYNVDLMWDALSDSFKAQLLQRGGSKGTLEAQLETQRQIGQTYGNPQYIGGVPLDSGGAMFFYLVDVTSPRPDQGGPTSYVFTVDADGKIIKIE